MIAALSVAVALAGTLSSTPPGALQVRQRVPPPADDKAVLADFGRRVQAYMDLRAEMTSAVLPFKITTDVGEIQRTVDKLAVGMRVSRAGARQGDTSLHPRLPRCSGESFGRPVATSSRICSR